MLYTYDMSWNIFIQKVWWCIQGVDEGWANCEKLNLKKNFGIISATVYVFFDNMSFNIFRKINFF